MRKIYGYARVSTGKQKVERQIANIKAEYPDAIIYQEAFTGTKANRPEWQKLLKKVKPGDLIVFDEVSRMSRNAEDGIETYFRLYDSGVELVFLKERYIDTSVYAESLKDKIELTGEIEDEIFKGLNNYFRKLAEKQIRIAFEIAQKEVDYLHKRVSEGLRQAQAQGKQVGREQGRTYETKKGREAKEVIRTHSKDFGGSLNDTDCQKLAQVSRNTYYKLKREIREGK